MRYVRGLRVVVLLGTLVLASGCSDGDDGARGSSETSAASTLATTSAETATPSSSPPQSPYSDTDTVLLAKDDCYGSAADDTEGRVEEMACDDPDAIGKVLKRVKEKMTRSTYIDCPGSTDDVLGVTDASGPELAGSRDYARWLGGVGYACVRNLKAPHPGDPGGGGMEIRVGDCLWTSGPTDQYKEVPCEGETLPDLKIVGEPDLYGNCPRKDDIKLAEDSYLDIAGLDGPTYCARHVTQQ